MLGWWDGVVPVRSPIAKKDSEPDDVLAYRNIWKYAFFSGSLDLSLSLSLSLFVYIHICLVSSLSPCVRALSLSLSVFVLSLSLSLACLCVASQPNTDMRAASESLGSL